MDKWEIARSTGVCSVSGQPLTEGDEYYVVLFEEGETFRRADYSVDKWDGPPADAFCHFKSRIPEKKTKKRLLVDNDLLINFFTRLAEEEDPARQRFRFVLALILMRKRLLRYEETNRAGEQELWRMRLVRDHSIHQVLNPHLADDQIESVSAQLGAILHGDMGEYPEPEEAADSAEEPQEVEDA
ncbi:MAG: hypothetical protein GY842_27345 [bacterium]|nr:hypothetical protein [bacterium]